MSLYTNFSLPRLVAGSTITFCIKSLIFKFPALFPLFFWGGGGGGGWGRHQMTYFGLAKKAAHTKSYIFSQNFPEKRVEFPERRFSSNKPFAT